MRLTVSRDFHLLWAGESVSAIGTQFSTLALPTLAILQLHAGPIAVGVLTGCGFAGYPVAGILAGPLVDRSSKRAILLAANAGRALLLGLVAADAVLGTIALWHLAVAALLASAITAVFDAAYQTLLPAIVPADRLLGANARLETSQSLAYFVGPASAGFVIQALGVVAAVVTDTLSYVFALVTVHALREGRRQPSGSGRASFFADLAEGVRAFRRFSFLLPIVTCVGISNAGNMMVRSLLLLLAYRAFALPPSAAGWILAAGGLAGVAGAPMAARVGTRLSLGSTLVVATFFEGFAWCLTPLGLLGHAEAVLIGAALISGLMTPIWNINSVTLRQRAVPLQLQARVVALSRAVGVGSIPIGTVIGGVAASFLINAYGTRIGLTTAVVAGGLIASASAIPLLLGRIPALRLPDAQAIAYQPQTS